MSPWVTLLLLSPDRMKNGKFRKAISKIFQIFGSFFLLLIINFSLLLPRFPEIVILFFCKVGPNWDTRTHAKWPIAVSFSFEFKGVFRVQPSYRGPQYHSALPLLFIPVPSLQSPRSAPLTFPMSTPT